MLKQSIHWMLSKLVKRFSVRTERAFWLVLRTALRHRFLIVLAFLANVLAAIFEGSSIGMLALAVASITAPGIDT